jgi:hypothetical protein
MLIDIYRGFPQSFYVNAGILPQFSTRRFISLITVILPFVAIHLMFQKQIPGDELIFFPLALQPQFGPWPTYMKLSVSLQFCRS